MVKNNNLEDLLFAVMGPKMYPSKAGWHETPKELETDIIFQRIAKLHESVKKGEQVQEATDAEVINYLMNASLNGPLSHEHFKIYSWLFAKHSKNKTGSTPIKAEKLEEYEKMLLKELKQKIYSKTRQVFKQRTSGKV